MNLTDTFYVALCMTILILGVVYWFWTQNQYMQRKLNLLENIVFEIKTQIQNGDTLSPPQQTNMTQTSPNVDVGASSSIYPPAPSSELGDDEDLLNEEIGDLDDSRPSPTLKINEDLMSASPSVNATDRATSIEAQILDDDHDDLAVALQPGGVGSGIKELPESDSSAKGNVLEGMTLKELQRLAEQKGINAARLRKPQLIEAIRAHSRPTPFEASESALE
jgi:hypothetical protein